MYKPAIITYSISYEDNRSILLSRRGNLGIDISDNFGNSVAELIEFLKEFVAEHYLGEKYREEYKHVQVVIDNIIWVDNVVTLDTNERYIDVEI